MSALFLFPTHSNCDAGVREKGEHLGFSHLVLSVAAAAAVVGRKSCVDEAEIVAAGDLERKNKAGK